MRGLLAEAERVLVGGVNSPVRAYRQIGGEPVVLVRGKGAEVVDVTGRRYTDFIMGWGALLLGHQPASVMRAITQPLRSATLLGLTHPAEVELARLIVEAVPSVEQVRFTASGTEACMTAVKLARACTNREKILLFAGGYHGHADSLMADATAGIPASHAQSIVRVAFNDIEALTETLRRDGRTIACAIVEPVPANIGVLVPTPGYLERLRRLTAQYGILLIFDEVVTGFRLGFGGAQEYFGVKPDLTTFGKIIGGGLPIGALGGPKRLMQRLAPEGDVYHGGTFAGHPLSMAAGIATLRALKAHPPYHALERLASTLADGLAEAARRRGVAVQVNRVGSMLTLYFCDRPVTSAAEAKASDRRRFAAWAGALRRQGVLVPPSPFEALFVSSAHTPRHVDQIVTATEAALQQPSRNGRVH